ncbi:MAG: hypothetical protein J6Q53_04115 [Oscillospiraceae bacterium]|nr:hypothetical protein [Oscillospiraceae bacterium]
MRYEIAGLKVDMAVSGKTQRQAAAYAAPAQGPADLQIHCPPPELVAEKAGLLTADEVEYLYTGGQFSTGLLDFNGFRLHASAVTLDSRAYLFSAFSGTGKSTHTAKWIRLFGATYLNDDKPALRKLDGVWTAFGTPWSGKHDLSSPEGVALGGVAFLTRGDVNNIRPLSPAEALPLLLGQTMRKITAPKMELLLPLVDDVLRSVPIWELTCRNDDDAAYTSHSAMTGGK